jgi:glycosyltransferase involved in cell wall biosynthesis
MPMRIVHAISSPAAGGAEVYVKDLAMALGRMGHQPAILFLSRSADIGRDDAFEKAFLADLDAHRIPYGFLGHACRRNPLLGAFRTGRFVRRHRADIYHSHLKYSLLFAAGLGVPHVHTHHNVRRHAPAWMWPLFNRIVDAWVVKPGISGWAQVNQGHVAAVEEVHRKLQYDFYYIKYFSPWLDILILMRTIKTMLTGFGSR